MRKSQKFIWLLGVAGILGGPAAAQPQFLWEDIARTDRSILVGQKTLQNLEHQNCYTEALADSPTTDSLSVTPPIPPASTLLLPPPAFPAATPPILSPKLAMAAPESSVPLFNQDTNLLEKSASTLAQVIDFDHLDLTASEARVFYLVVPTKHIQPFWSFAREVENPRDDSARIGMGTGLRLNITPNASFGAETILFSHDRNTPELDRTGPLSPIGETQFLTRFQIKF